MYRVLGGRFLPDHPLFLLVPSLHDKSRVLVFQSFPQQRLVAVVDVVVVVQDPLKTFLQFVAETFADGITAEICKDFALRAYTRGKIYCKRRLPDVRTTLYDNRGVVLLEILRFLLLPVAFIYIGVFLRFAFRLVYKEIEINEMVIDKTAEPASV